MTFCPFRIAQAVDPSGEGVACDQFQHAANRSFHFSACQLWLAGYALYRRWLAEAAVACGLAIHAYVLMTNHVHLLATPRDADSRVIGVRVDFFADTLVPNLLKGRVT